MKDDSEESKAREIEEVRRQNERKKRYVDPDAVRKTQNEVLRLFKEGDERKYLAAIRRAGLKDGTPEFARAVEVFRRHHRRD